MRARTTLLIVAAAMVAAGRALAADVSLPSALPSFGVGVDSRQLRAVRAAPGEFVLDFGYALRLGRSWFDDRGRVRDLTFNGEFCSQSFPVFVTYGVNRTLTAGVSTSLANWLEESFSITNFQPGATLSGAALPLFRTSTYRLSGSSLGDTQLNFQKAMSKEGLRTQKLVTLDITLPTGRADSRGPSDLPPGKGNADTTLSVIMSREFYPLRGFVRIGQEFNTSGTMRNAAGIIQTVRSGDGPNLDAGVVYSHSPFLQLKSTFVAFAREERIEAGRIVAESARNGLEWRPGLDINIAGVSLSLEGLLPLAGRNIIRTQGFYQYAEVRF